MEKARRDPLVVADRARGISWPQIAKRHDLSEKACRTIWNDHLRKQPLNRVDLRDALVEAITQLEAVIEDLALLAERTHNDPTRLGAVKARLDAMSKKQELLQLAGLLPNPVHAALVKAEAQQVSEAFLETFRKYVPALQQDQAEFEILAALEPLRRPS